MESTSNNYSRYLPYVAAGAAASAAIYLLYRWFSPLTPYVSEHVEENLPVAKKLKTIPDAEGNYDIDGVSFDSEGVIVSGDDNKPIKPTIN